MMRNPSQTIGNIIDKQGVSFVGSIDEAGFPNMKAMLPPRKHEGIKEFWFSTNTSSIYDSRSTQPENARSNNVELQINQEKLAMREFKAL